MFTSIKIRDFRSIQEATFVVRPGVNVLVGPNGSGKTNILHALKFISSVLVNGAALAMGKAGGPARNFRKGKTAIFFDVVAPYEDAIYRGKKTKFFLKWGMEIGVSQQENIVQIVRESIRVLSPDEETVLRIELSRASGAVKSVVHIAPEGIMTKKIMSSPSGPRGRYKKSDLYDAMNKGVLDAISVMKKAPNDASMLQSFRWLNNSVADLLREMASFDEYNIKPEFARRAIDPVPVAKMDVDGAGVGEVVNALESENFFRISNTSFSARYYGERNKYFYFDYGYGYNWINQKNNPLPEIVSHLQSAVSGIDGVGTDIDPSTGRRFVVFRSENNNFRPDEVSDGTIKWLCLLVAIYVPQSRVILLEEPENFMHPWMQQRFISLIRDQAKKHKRSVILTTHSVTVLNALVAKELLLVNHSVGGTVVQNVKDRASLEKMLESTNFGLGDAWVSGAIGGVLGDAE